MSADVSSKTETFCRADISTVAWFDMLPKQLAFHLRKLADEIEAGGPSPSEIATAHIENWALARRMVPCLIGLPTGHPTIANGNTLMSSELFYMDVERGLARSFSRWYRLGNRVDPEFWNRRYTAS